MGITGRDDITGWAGEAMLAVGGGCRHGVLGDGLGCVGGGSWLVGRDISGGVVYGARASVGVGGNVWTGDGITGCGGTEPAWLIDVSGWVGTVLAGLVG